MRTNDALNHLPDMAVFARVVEAGSFNGAARALGLTPSAVSRQVARLEALLRVRLLERTTRRLRLTEAGHTALAHCQQLEASAREVLQLADAHTSAPSGLVRMSVPKAYGRQRIHPLVPGFLAAYPQVDVQLWVNDRHFDPLADDLDLVLRITDAPPPGLAGRPLEQVEHLVCASPAYLARCGTPRTPHDLAAHDCIRLGESDADRRWRFARTSTQETVAVHGRYACNHSENRRDAALAGLGIATLPAFTAAPALASGALLPLLTDWRHDTPYSGTAWLLYPSSRYLPARLRVWIDHLAQHLAAPLLE